MRPPRSALHALHALLPLFLGIVAGVIGVPLRAAEWLPASWRGESAWESISESGWIATVSVDRARLIALRRAPDGPGLLFADLKNEFSWGGHRVWLGPQSAWRAPWPPPADWETSRAERIATDGAALRITHPRSDPAYPRLTRSYEWRGDALHCGVSWSDPRFQAIHVVQLPTRAVVRVRPVPKPDLPLGYALLPIYGRDGLHLDRQPHPAVTSREGGSLVLRHAFEAEKIGLPPQTIVADIPPCRLTMLRGEMRGQSPTAPDLGLVTQIYLGAEIDPFTEIEQLSFLGGDGESFAEIILVPEKIDPAQRIARPRARPPRR